MLYFKIVKYFWLMIIMKEIKTDYFTKKNVFHFMKPDIITAQN